MYGNLFVSENQSTNTFTDRVSDRFRHVRAQNGPVDFPHHDRRGVWPPSPGVCVAPQMGYGWLDGFLHLSYPYLHVYASDLLILAYG